MPDPRLMEATWGALVQDDTPHGLRDAADMCRWAIQHLEARASKRSRTP